MKPTASGLKASMMLGADSQRTHNVPGMSLQTPKLSSVRASCRHSTMVCLLTLALLPSEVLGLFHHPLHVNLRSLSPWYYHYGTPDPHPLWSPDLQLFPSAPSDLLMKGLASINKLHQQMERRSQILHDMRQKLTQQVGQELEDLAMWKAADDVITHTTYVGKGLADDALDAEIDPSRQRITFRVENSANGVMQIVTRTFDLPYVLRDPSQLQLHYNKADGKLSMILQKPIRLDGKKVPIVTTGKESGVGEKNTAQEELQNKPEELETSKIPGDIDAESRQNKEEKELETAFESVKNEVMSTVVDAKA